MFTTNLLLRRCPSSPPPSKLAAARLRQAPLRCQDLLRRRCPSSSLFKRRRCPPPPSTAQMPRSAPRPLSKLVALQAPPLPAPTKHRPDAQIRSAAAVQARRSSSASTKHRPDAQIHSTAQ
ncbi:hypothetical protein Salat_2805800 [Sesamum alatum]|uniref:Uncharacterized protein n=1 Tax=Sesamum alatum TaxID=300844 RepID=A0AAE2C9Q0_9LAMI|nr:hypothetical protein Salat_2805800 [Sesamum alatum]